MASCSAVQLRARLGERLRPSVLARGSRTAADRHSFKVDVDLTAAGRALLRRRPRGFHATLVATGIDSVGRTRTVRERVQLHRGR